MKKLAILFVLLGLQVSAIAPAMAQNKESVQQQSESESSDMYRNYYRVCFKLKKNTIQVPYNLTAKQKEFLTVARFSSKEAMDNYILTNSVQNTFKRCLNNSWEVPGFSRKRIGRNTYQYNSKKTNFTLVNGSEKQVIQGAINVEVKYKRNGTRTIVVTRTA